MASPFPAVDGLPATYLEFVTGPAPHWPAKTPAAPRRIKGVETGPGRVSPPGSPWAGAPPGTDHADLATLLARVAVGDRAAIEGPLRALNLGPVAFRSP